MIKKIAALVFLAFGVGMTLTACDLAPEMDEVEVDDD